MTAKKYATSNAIQIKRSLKKLPIGSHLELILYEGVVCDHMGGAAMSPVVNWKDPKDVREVPGMRVTGYLAMFDDYQNHFKLSSSEVIPSRSESFMASLPLTGGCNLYYDTIHSNASIKFPNPK